MFEPHLRGRLKAAGRTARAGRKPTGRFPPGREPRWCCSWERPPRLHGPTRRKPTGRVFRGLRFLEEEKRGYFGGRRAPFSMMRTCRTPVALPRSNWTRPSATIARSSPRVSPARPTGPSPKGTRGSRGTAQPGSDGALPPAVKVQVKPAGLGAPSGQLVLGGRSVAAAGPIGCLPATFRIHPGAFHNRGL